MESKTTLVRTKSTVELNTETTVDLAFALVILPGDTELDDALGDGGDFEGFAVFGMLVEELAVFDGGGELLVGLRKSTRHVNACDLGRIGEWELALPARTLALTEDWTSLLFRSNLLGVFLV